MSNENKLSPVKVYIPERFTFATPHSEYHEAKFKSDYEYLKEQSLYVFNREELETLLMNCYNDAAWNEQDGKHAQKGQADVLISYINSLFKQ